MAFLSIIIPVLGQTEDLERCLGILVDQIGSQVDTEILVVDNSIGGPAPALVSRYPEVCWLHEPVRGSYRARNKGIVSAKGDVLAFLDADCLPSTDWMRGALEIARESGVAGITGGPIDVFVDHTGEPTAAELWELEFAFPAEDYLERDSFIVTANMLVRRDVFDRVGLFDSRLLSGGDYEFCQRAASHGVSLALDRRMRISHPARSTVMELVRKRRRVVRGRFMIAEIQGNTPSLAEIARSLPPPLRRLLRTAGRSGGRQPLDRLKMVLVEATLHQVGVWEKVRLHLADRVNPLRRPGGPRGS